MMLIHFSDRLALRILVRASVGLRRVGRLSAQRPVLLARLVTRSLGSCLDVVVDDSTIGTRASVHFLPVDVELARQAPGGWRGSGAGMGCTAVSLFSVFRLPPAPLRLVFTHRTRTVALARGRACLLFVGLLLFGVLSPFG